MCVCVHVYECCTPFISVCVYMYLCMYVQCHAHMYPPRSTSQPGTQCTGSYSHQRMWKRSQRLCSVREAGRGDHHTVTHILRIHHEVRINTHRERRGSESHALCVYAILFTQVYISCLQHQYPRAPSVPSDVQEISDSHTLVRH